jgi:hypothetical protein
MLLPHKLKLDQFCLKCYKITIKNQLFVYNSFIKFLKEATTDAS